MSKTAAILRDIGIFLIGISVLIATLHYINRPPTYEERMQKFMGDQFIKGMTDAMGDAHSPTYNADVAIKASNTSSQKTCVDNHRMIDAGKEQWTLANQKTNGDEVVISGANEYMKGNTTPICPQGGIYTYNVIGDDPGCSGTTQRVDGIAIPHKMTE